jgi:hypothetical protein
MRSACSAGARRRVIAGARRASPLLLFALVLAGCGRPADSESGEFRKLESVLGDLGASPESEWIDRLEAVKRLPIASPRVAAVRDTCAGAYEKFGEATARLSSAREEVSRLEVGIARAVDGGSAVEVARLHERARRAADGVTASLDEAERRVRDCEEARGALRRELAAP